MQSLIPPIPYDADRGESQLENERRFRYQVQKELFWLHDQVTLLKKEVADLQSRVATLENP